MPFARVRESGHSTGRIAAIQFVGQEQQVYVTKRSPVTKNFVPVLNRFLLFLKSFNRHAGHPMTDVKRGLGRAIKGLRNQHGITQEELAEQASLHRTYISDIERGARNPSLETLVRLAAALQISLAEMFKDIQTVQQADLRP